MFTCKDADSFKPIFQRKHPVMQTNNPQALFTNADQLMHTANEELNRAAEDAVTHLICHNSRQSIANYLMGYLIEKGVHLPYPTTLAGLLEKCQSIDPRFQKIDLSPIHCRLETGDKDYCLDQKTVDECFHIARRTQALVRQDV